MNTVLISLKRAKERRDRMLTLLNKLNIDAVILDAIDGQELPPEFLNKRICLPQGYRFGEILRSGEIGCTLSHVKAINYAKEHKWEYVIILEDDVVICDDFSKRLELLFKMLPSNWQHVFLGGFTYNAPAPLVLPSVLPVNFKVSGTYSYILHKSAYDIAIKTLESLQTSADDLYEYMFKSFNIKSYIFYPFFTYPLINDSYVWEITGNEGTHPSIKYYKQKMR